MAPQEVNYGLKITSGTTDDQMQQELSYMLLVAWFAWNDSKDLWLSGRATAA